MLALPTAGSGTRIGSSSSAHDEQGKGTQAILSASSVPQAAGCLALRQTACHNLLPPHLNATARTARERSAPLLSLVYSSRSASTSSLVTAQQAGVQCMRQRFMCAAALTTSQLALRPGGAGGGVRWGHRSLGLPWPGTWQPAPLSRTCTCLSKHARKARSALTVGVPRQGLRRVGVCRRWGILYLAQTIVGAAGRRLSHCRRAMCAAHVRTAAVRASGPAAADQLLRTDRWCPALWTAGPWLEV